MNAQPAPQADPTRWRVIAQEMTTAPDDTGRAVRGRRVTYQLASGQSGQVFVPNDRFNPEAVAAAIHADAANVAAVANLVSGG